MSKELKEFFGKMSTEQLNELLEIDYKTGGDLSGETILVIMEVLKEREDKGNIFDEFPDNETAWAKFSETYLSNSKASESEMASFADEKDTTPSVASPAKKAPKKCFGKVLKAASIALVGVLVTAVVSVSASAAGYDIWGNLSSWTAERFNFGESYTGIPVSAGYTGKYATMQEALEAYNITEQLAPTWLPEGYALQDISITITDEKTNFRGKYVNDTDAEVVVYIVQHFDDFYFWDYEKKDLKPEIYVMSGREHYFFENLEQSSIVWGYENFECSIIGVFSNNDFKQVIDSIYER